MYIKVGDKVRRIKKDNSPHFRVRDVGVVTRGPYNLWNGWVDVEEADGKSRPSNTDNLELVQEPIEPRCTGEDGEVANAVPE